MDTRRYARFLGRLGGLARARNLDSEERCRIASQGGLARSLSRHAVRRIEDNFRYLDAVSALRRTLPRTDAR
jgi:hypothetical protein